MKPKLLLCLALVLNGSSISTFADETNAALSKPEVEMYLGVNGKTNNSAVTLDATNSLKEFVNSVTTNYQNLILSSTNLVPTNFLRTLPMLAEYMQTNALAALTNSSVTEMGAAGKFMVELKNKVICREYQRTVTVN